MRIRLYLVWGRLGPGGNGESLIAARLTRFAADKIAGQMDPPGRVEPFYADKEETLVRGEGMTK